MSTNKNLMKMRQMNEIQKYLHTPSGMLEYSSDEGPNCSLISCHECPAWNTEERHCTITRIKRKEGT